MLLARTFPKPPLNPYVNSALSGTCPVQFLCILELSRLLLTICTCYQPRITIAIRVSLYVRQHVDVWSWAGAAGCTKARNNSLSANGEGGVRRGVQVRPSALQMPYPEFGTGVPKPER